MNGPKTARIAISETKVVVCTGIELTKFETSFMLMFFLNKALFEI